MPLRDMDREQMWLLPPSLDELLPLNHPARSAGSSKLDSKTVSGSTLPSFKWNVSSMRTPPTPGTDNTECPTVRVIPLRSSTRESAGWIEHLALSVVLLGTPGRLQLPPTSINHAPFVLCSHRVTSLIRGHGWTVLPCCPAQGLSPRSIGCGIAWPSESAPPRRQWSPGLRTSGIAGPVLLDSK